MKEVQIRFEGMSPFFLDNYSAMTELDDWIKRAIGLYQVVLYQIILEGNIL